MESDCRNLMKKPVIKIEERADLDCCTTIQHQQKDLLCPFHLALSKPWWSVCRSA